MPAWGMHIALANILNKKWKLPYDTFLIGNILPDIGNGYTIAHPSLSLPYSISHFAKKMELENIEGEVLPDVNAFLSRYQKQLHDPIILGYLTHLLADFYWNWITYQKFWWENKNTGQIGVKKQDGSIILCQNETRKKWKREDFHIFTSYLLQRMECPDITYQDSLLQGTSKILEFDVPKTDVMQAVALANEIIHQAKESIITEEYQLYTLQELKQEWDRCITFITQYIENS